MAEPVVFLGKQLSLGLSQQFKPKEVSGNQSWLLSMDKLVIPRAEKVYLVSLAFVEIFLNHSVSCNTGQSQTHFVTEDVRKF